MSVQESAREFIPISNSWRERLLQRLSRETSAGRFIPEIDGLRFIAIASVVLFHAEIFITKKLGLPTTDSWLAAVMSKGAIGVQLFFVISGFIISLPFAQTQISGRPHPTLGAYYRRRLTRLEPPYVLNLLLIAMLQLLLGKLTLSQLWPHLLSSVTYTHTLIHGEPSWINGVTWSLEVECQFYLVAPLLAQVFRIGSVRPRRALLLLGILLSSCISEVVAPRSARWALSLPSHLNYFLCGFLLADLFAPELAQRSTVQQRARGSYVWDAVGVFAWLSLLGLLFAPKSVRMLMTIPILLGYCAAFRGRLCPLFLGNRYVYTVGGMCYTIYLYHEFVLSFCGGLLVRIPGMASLPTWLALTSVTVIFLPVLLGACAALFLMAEKPFMYANWPKLLQTRSMGLLSRRSSDESPARASR